MKTPKRLWFAVPFLCLLLAAFGSVGRAAPAGFPDKLELIRLLRAEDYEILERRLNALQEKYELGDDSNVQFAFLSFANSAADLERHLTAWVRRSGRSYAALGARGIYYNSLGWLARQNRFAQHTHPDQFRRMRDYFKKSKDDLSAAIHQRPRFAVAYAELLEMAIADGNWDLRKEIFNRAVAADAAAAPVFFKYMWGLHPNWGGSLGAMEAFSRYADDKRLSDHRVPKLQRFIYALRAREYSRAERYGDAIRILSDGIAYDESPFQYIARGDNYQSLGKHEKAIRDFSHSLELWPQNVDALRERAWSYRRLKRIKLALADLDLALRLDPRNPNILKERMSVHWRQKNFDAALQDLDDAMEFGSFDANIVSSRGELHLGYTKDYAKAAGDFERAVELVPDKPNYWYNLAVAYFWGQDCRTVEATKRFVELCSADKGCPENKVRQSIKIIRDFLKSHTECTAEPPAIPREPPLYVRLWERFKRGVARTLSWLFLEPEPR